MLSGMPKAYEKEVQRIRQAITTKNLLLEQEEKKARGEGYDKLRLSQVQAPNFTQKNKRNLLLYVQVNITPTR